MQNYKISYKSHLRVAGSILLYAAIAIIVILIILLQNINDTIFVVKTIIGISIILNGPAIFLHFSYYLDNDN